MSDEQPRAKTDPTKWPVKTTLILALIFLGLWAFWPAFVRIFYPLEKPSDLAGLGDAYGSINALFSGMAMIGAIVAIFMQWHELRLQRDDLKVQQDMLLAQLNEAKEQRGAIEQQAKAMERLAEETAAQNFHLKNQNDLAKLDLAFRKGIREQDEREAFLRSLPLLEVEANISDSNKFILSNHGSTIYSLYIRNDNFSAKQPASFGPDSKLILRSNRWLSPKPQELHITFQTGRGEWMDAFLTIDLKSSGRFCVENYKKVSESEIPKLDANLCRVR